MLQQECSPKRQARNDNSQWQPIGRGRAENVVVSHKCALLVALILSSLCRFSQLKKLHLECLPLWGRQGRRIPSGGNVCR